MTRLPNLWPNKASRAISRYYKAAGIRAVAAYFIATLTRHPWPLVIHSPRSRHPLYLRAGTTDLSVYNQIMVETQYGLIPDRMPEFIVDAGANTGLSALYFNYLYPNAKIVAIEPAHSNFIVLQHNTARCANIIGQEAALWGHRGAVHIVNCGAGAHGYRTSPTVAKNFPCTEIEATTITDIMERHRLPRIDILKIDIEGSEIEVFNSSTDWIRSVTTIMVELHDNFRPGCRSAFEAVTSGFPYQYQRRETVVRSRCVCAVRSH